MTGTSRVRRLHVVEPSPDQHEPQESPREPSAGDNEAPLPDGTDAADLDAALTGMSVLLRVALRLMKSSGTGGR
jgi:hypothetical protein